MSLKRNKKPSSSHQVLIYKSKLIILSVLFALSFGLHAKAEFDVPRLTGPVVDNANLISSHQKRQLSEALLILAREGGPQLAILTVDHLGGETIEQASIKVVDRWKLGDQTRDDGLLIMVAKKERKMRIEVGQGLEGVMTDLQSKRIISKVMSPAFKSGDFDFGFGAAVYKVIEIVAPKSQALPFLSGKVRKKHGRNFRSDEKKSPSIGLIFFLAFFMLPIFFGRPMRTFGGRRYSGRSYGGFGGGGFGGGGFGGGGGGFSGGGASGGW